MVVMTTQAESAEVDTTFVSFDREIPGVVYEPVVESEQDHIAFVFMHPDADYLAHPGGEALAKRGFRALGVNNHSARKGSYHLHDLLPDLARAVRFLREKPKVETIILVGHSGGAHLSSFYQNVAENGWDSARSSEKLYPAPKNMPELPEADGLILLDGHTGYGPKGVLDLGPHIAKEETGIRSEFVDMYSSEHGFDQHGPATYDDEFLDQYFGMQVDRAKRLQTIAQKRTEALENGDGDFVDDEPFVLADIKSRVYKTDPSLLSQTKSEWTLVRGNGTRTKELIQSVRDPKETDSEPPLRYHGDEVMPMTVQKYLSTHTARIEEDFRLTKDSIRGIDFESTNASTIGNIRDVTVPLLVLPATGHYFIVQGEMFYCNAGSQDKSLIYIHGGDHGFEPIREEFGDTFGAAFDEISRWTSDRFV
jgi:pimeloyl-ACP methyl ester carboxylesterase